MTPTALVTGIGVTAPNGLGTDAFWTATLSGVNGIGKLTRFDPDQYPMRLAGEIPGFAVADHLPTRLIAQTDRMTQLSLVAAEWAVADSGADLGGLSPFEMAVTTSAASGGFEFGQRELEKLWRQGPSHVSTYMSFAWFYAVNSGQISIRHDLRGPMSVFVGDQAGGIDAVAHARRAVRKGAKLVLTGGVDGSLSPYGWAAQLATGRLSPSPDPRRAYLPFSAEACGYVPGEGGAMLVVEDAGRARARGAGGYAEIAGYGSTFDPPPASEREPGLRRAAELALADAGLGADDVDVVFADAAGVPELDQVEALALAKIFGPHAVPVTAPKTMTGRLYSGGAALDLATAALSIRDGVIPPSINIGQPAAKYELDLVTDAPRRIAVRTALVLARGWGGFNSAMVLKKPS
ncbi:ketosynthase chain-length factor [Nocardia arthritidis]|uniref:Ketosynthase chain-length factor n=1 Tax=Nocardia arthritidis TaxID=228602 RepID=A0A6G9YA06_9NOCA|nr:ketosynthase chain-length factor [Nocardia arthritidis]QIS10042.1 ketosynthase chain-length factor [Nocardia arthritidis]